LAAFVLVSTQEPLQFVSLLEQDETQLPFEHTRPAPHAVPQAPQLFGSLWRFAQVSAHLMKPDLHTNPQLPASQVALAFAGSGHSLLQAPQLAGSCLVSTHALSHLSRPSPQSKSQAPPVHLGIPPGTAGHWLSHPPQ
jgi:hypothetical protein